jgi:hypothetical protein
MLVPQATKGDDSVTWIGQRSCRLFLVLGPKSYRIEPAVHHGVALWLFRSGLGPVVEYRGKIGGEILHKHVIEHGFIGLVPCGSWEPTGHSGPIQ